MKVSNRAGRGSVAVRMLALGCVQALACLFQPAGLQAMPLLPAMSGVARSDVTQAQTVCDYRGCFGFGQKQWYRPPSYRPPGYRPPVYYRPRAAGTPPLIYRPQAPAPAPAAQPPALTGSRHVQWCLNRYRSYDPATNRYVTTSGTSAECRSPPAK